MSRVFHDGERAVQERVSPQVREKMDRLGERMIRDFMPDQHRLFFEEQPFLVVGSLDTAGRPWASLVTGIPGFASTPDARTLLIEGGIATGDPLAEHLLAGAPLGILGIQPETRRRNRANGVIQGVTGGTVSLHVTQSFGNCPKYIQARAPRFRRDPTLPLVTSSRAEGRTLSDRARAIVESADTFFIASASVHAETDGVGEGVDVSHRGGPPGFVQVEDEDGRTVFTWPDYVGNFLFNTLGNLQVNPHAGLVFPDFETGDVLTLTGDTEIVWDGPEVERFPGAQRLFRFRVTEGRLLEGALPFSWTEAELAPEFE